MENDGRDASADLDAIAQARAAVLRRTRTPGWYFVTLSMIISAFVLAGGLGIDEWWGIPVMALVVLGCGIIIGALRHASGAWTAPANWPADTTVPAVVIAVIAAVAPAVLHFSGAPWWAAVVLAVVLGPAAGVVTAVIARRWEAARVAP